MINVAMQQERTHLGQFPLNFLIERRRFQKTPSSEPLRALLKFTNKKRGRRPFETLGFCPHNGSHQRISFLKNLSKHSQGMFAESPKKIANFATVARTPNKKTVDVKQDFLVKLQLGVCRISLHLTKKTEDGFLNTRGVATRSARKSPLISRVQGKTKK